ncbi:PD-(D/E)XK nuclease superfamily protein [Mycobacterium xenopi 3993]|nr:PD-(D/E)XK nuclease superfamily protein [Mycobacterium xenopi 3993]
MPFEMALGDTVVRGRIDAVFADPDGGATVVDWKPVNHRRGRRPSACRGATRRLPAGMGGVAGLPESVVRAAFYYVRSGVTVVPDALPGPDELAALVSDK